MFTPPGSSISAGVGCARIGGNGFVPTPARGYNIHHIVEQTPADKDGFPRASIDAPDKLVRVPTLKHWEINRWFETKNDDYGGITPREYVRGIDWERRRQVGLRALVEAGVLNP